MAVRVPAFVHLARMVRETGVAAVLPEITGVDFGARKIVEKPTPRENHRQIALIANVRSLDRSGVRSGAAEKLAEPLRLE